MNKYFEYLHDESINWKEVQRNLPYSLEDKEAIAHRLSLFKKFDKNGNVSLSLDEVLDGFKELGDVMDPVLKNKEISKMAF